jgi:DNA polymerase III sliding clamp (beta) subunit (PCNA family)
MKFEIELPVRELKAASAGLGKVIGRSSLPVLHCVRMERNQEGIVMLQATDLDSLATYRIKAPGPAGELLVPWEHFTRIVKKTRDRASFVQESKDKVLLRSFLGSIAFEELVETPSNHEWPILPLAKTPMALDESFKAAFAEAMRCVSRNENRHVLNGVCLDLTAPGEHYLVATNGRHLYSANSFNFHLKHSIIVPDRKFLNWSGFKEDGEWTLRASLTEAEEKGGWIEIASDRWAFGTKLVEASYPNWRQIIPTDDRTLTVVCLTPESLATLVEALPRMPTDEERNCSITLSVQDKQLLIQSRPHEQAPWSELPLPGVTIEGPDQRVSLNREYLLKALRIGLCQIEIRDALTPVVLRKDGKRMVIAVLRPGVSGSVPPVNQNSEAISPSEPQSQPVTESERNSTMTSPINTSSMEPNKPTTSEESLSVVSHVESIRSALKETLNDLNQAIVLLKSAEKEKKATEREIESVRATLRSLQKVQI